MKRTFPTPEPVRLLIELPAGRVELETTDSGETTVELEPLNGADASARAVEEATVEHREHGERHELRIEVGKRRSFSFGRTPEVLVTVRCPPLTTVQLSAAAADVRGVGQFADVEIKNVSGDTSFTDIEGNARLKAVSGDIWAGRVTGDAEVGTVSGDVRLEHVGGECTVRTVSGDLSIPDAVSSVRATSVSGDHHLEAVTSGSIELQSVSGDVHVGVRRGTDVWLDLNSRSGDVSSELDESDGPGGSASVQVRAATVSGDITVVRAAAREPANHTA